MDQRGIRLIRYDSETVDSRYNGASAYPLAMSFCER